MFLILLKTYNGAAKNEFLNFIFSQPQIGIFYIDGDAFIKQMGNGERILLNLNYPNIPIKEFDSVHCFGKDIGVLDV